jgi:putative phosphoesterase
MKIVVFGDVHGNLVALEKLFTIEKKDTDVFVSHGDVVNYGPWSNECVQFLNEQKNCHLLRGNHEDYFISNKYPGHHPIAKAFFEFCYPKFDMSLIDTINKYETDLGFGNFIIQHTISDKKIFLDTNVSDIDINKNYIIGHSHQQFQREINKFKLINTGSLGQNRKFINQSCYIILDTVKNSVELKSFTHDIDKLINKMKADRYPDICIKYYQSKERL